MNSQGTPENKDLNNDSEKGEKNLFDDLRDVFDINTPRYPSGNFLENIEPLQQKDKTNLIEQLSVLHAAFTTVQDQYKEFTKMRTALEVTRSNYVALVACNQANKLKFFERSNNEHKNLQVKLQTLQAENQGYVEELTATKMQLDKVNAENQQLQSELQVVLGGSADLEKVQLMAQLAGAHRQVEKLRAENIELRAKRPRNGDLLERVQLMEQQLEILEEKYVKTSAFQKKLEEEKQFLIRLNETLTQELRNEKNNIHYQHDLSQAVQHLRLQLENLIESNKELLASSELVKQNNTQYSTAELGLRAVGSREQASKENMVGRFVHEWKRQRMGDVPSKFPEPKPKTPAYRGRKFL